MTASNKQGTGGRKRPSKAVYQRDPAEPQAAPKKPKHLVRGESLTVRFTEAEWESIQAKATQAGTTPTAIVRAGALGVAVQAVVSRQWTPEERADYRSLVNGMNNLNQLAKASHLGTLERAQVQQLYASMRSLLASLVPTQVGQKEAAA